jgi:hypothetical protein
MRDPAWTVLAALASLLLCAVAAGPPVRAADREPATDAVGAQLPDADPAPSGDVIGALSAPADAEPPEAPAPAAELPAPDAAQSPDATEAGPADSSAEPAKEAAERASPSALEQSADTDATRPDEAVTTTSPEAGAARSPDATETEPAEPAFTSTAGSDAERPDAGAAEQPSPTAEAPSADEPSQQFSESDQAEADQTPDPSPTVRQLADWAVSSGDAGGLPVMIIDKLAAAVFIFDPSGQLQGSAPALLGSALGDDSAPGVGDRELSQIPLEDRTTPAGRFIAHLGPAAGFRSVLWVDYATATSLHAVITNYPQERRLERLKSPNPDDRRITHGCINVPAAFYKDVVRPTFADTMGVVYILPDVKKVAEVFPGFADGWPMPRARADLQHDLP